MTESNKKYGQKIKIIKNHIKSLEINSETNIQNLNNEFFTRNSLKLNPSLRNNLFSFNPTSSNFQFK